MEKNTTPYPVAFLAQLENIAEKGLDAFALAGSFEKGFRLVICKKCEDTGINQTVGEDREIKGGACSCPLGDARAEQDDLDAQIEAQQEVDDEEEAEADADTADSNEDPDTQDGADPEETGTGEGVE